jgi:uridine kinase
MRQLLGIDGGQGSGKTTYAKQLLAKLRNEGNDAVYIETDDFLSERSFRDALKSSFFDDISNLELLFDFDSMGKTLAEMLDTNNRSLTLYNGATGLHDRSKAFELSDDSVVLVGGPYLLHATWPTFSRKIFLKAPLSVRRERTLERNKTKTRSDASQRTLFANFEKFYTPYWNNRLAEYDEIIDSFTL